MKPSDFIRQEVSKRLKAIGLRKSRMVNEAFVITQVIIDYLDEQAGKEVICPCCGMKNDVCQDCRPYSPGYKTEDTIENKSNKEVIYNLINDITKIRQKLGVPEGADILEWLDKMKIRCDYASYLKVRDILRKEAIKEFSNDIIRTSSEKYRLELGNRGCDIVSGIVFELKEKYNIDVADR